MSSSSCSTCSWTKWEQWVNLRFYLFVSGINQRNEEGRWVQNFLELPQGLRSFLSVSLRTRWRNLVRVECLQMIKAIVVDLEVDVTLNDGLYYYCFFYSYLQWFWKNLWMGVGFENTCTFSGKWNVSRVVTRFYRLVYKILKTTPLLV